MIELDIAQLVALMGIPSAITGLCFWMIQSQLAKKADINSRVLQTYEQDDRDIAGAKLKTLLKVCVALECRLEDIVTDDETHAGTKEDPIPAVAGMEYEKGKYYSDGGKLYLMNRQGMNDGDKITLYYLPSQLVGQYFEEAA